MSRQHNNSEDIVQKKDKYDPSAIEPKWQAKWENDRLYQPELKSAKNPYYNLHMFPYPSAEGLHVGNVYAFTGADIHGRFKRMQGKTVFQPFGLDGFGIHSENYALKIGSHPMGQAEKSEKRFYAQVRSLGSGYDWSRTLETYAPSYYQWTQWLFTELFKAGLAYRASLAVNFCPSCKTVLADEQVIDGKCERCSSVVEKRELKQWLFRITEYAEQLLEGLERIDWTEKVKIAQRNWIGKKDGINITYKVENSEKKIAVFTTRPDTNFGATFIALAPENPLAIELATEEQKEVLKKYIKRATSRSEIERQAEGRGKSGVFTGSYVINQLNGYRMPVWVSDFVLSGFGTGALVGVPGHDRRDFEFAQKFNLEIKRVVVGKDKDQSPIIHIDQVQEREGLMVNSDFLNGMDIHEATSKIMAYMEEEGYGERKTTYHLRDWLISRQRYWGPPIPMIYCESCASEGKSWFDTEEGKARKSTGWPARHASQLAGVAGWYPEENLPVLLPRIQDYQPLGSENSPLGNHPEFYDVDCPGCEKKARRETDVSDTFLDSSWYFLRYISPQEKGAPWDQELGKKWLPPTIYTGGAEHSVLHLLYARFIYKALGDLGYLDTATQGNEPFPIFYAHGLIIKDGAKMSKSKGNVVVPDEYVKKFGADALRSYLMFLGPFNMGGDFRDSGIDGMYRFIKRVWTIVASQKLVGTDPDKSAMRVMHAAIKGVTEDLEAFRYNTAIAKIMTYYNFLSGKESISKEEARTLLQILAPFAPHMTEELWERMGESGSIHTSMWPGYDEAYLVSDTITIAVQVNGKFKMPLVVSVDEAGAEQAVSEKAKANEKIKNALAGRDIKQVIYVQGKVLNFVLR